MVCVIVFCFDAVKLTGGIGWKNYVKHKKYFLARERLSDVESGALEGGDVLVGEGAGDGEDAGKV